MRPMRAPRPLLPLFLLVSSAFSLASLVGSQEANAYERQFHAGFGLGYSLIVPSVQFVRNTAFSGIGATGHLAYGLSDTFNLLADVEGAFFPGEMPIMKVGGNVGVGYVFDVLRIVPYAGVMVGGAGLIPMDPCSHSPEGTCGGARLSFSIPFGVDYQLSRNFAIGAAGKYGVLLLGAEGAMQTISATLRAEYIWGY